MSSCACCGNGVERAGARGPVPKYCSDACKNRAKWERQKAANPCPKCGGPMALGALNTCRDCQKSPHGEVARYKRGCRCDLCTAAKRDAHREYARARRAAGRPIRPRRIYETRLCEYCGVEYQARACTRQRFCSLECARDVQGRRPEPRFHVSRSLRIEIYEECEWACQLCGSPVRPDEDSNHPRYPTLDHIVPRSKGGSDERENLRLACRQCNTLRGADMDWVPAEAVA